jgi:uncharacterized membrane protein YjfL (UPF0719 family)
VEAVIAVVEGMPRLALALAMFLVGLRVFARLARVDLIAEVRHHGNPAAAAWLVGQIVGLALALRGAQSGTDDLLAMTLSTVIGGALAVFALPIGAILLDGLVLHRFDTSVEITRDRNLGTGLVLGAGAAATGMALEAALTGESGSVVMAVFHLFLYFGVAQGLMAAGAWIWVKLAPFDVHDALERRDSVAVGAAMAGFLLAVGVLLRAVVMGGGDDLGHTLLRVLVDGAAGVAVQLALTVPLTRLLLRAPVGELIDRDHNAAAGVLCGAVAVSVAVLMAGALRPW